ncbi:hypothetical protein [Amycolatopsis tolypomycina]|uniref:SH3 domain-containing protein n=1 Tax=Amycolatopsis tolypomycina TaxID=208445 RepID=A0A1H4YGI9_9PSEU|nr:hypothetical protein [Amycolatopsis tolypomycina]SED16231.1 hypothetical protein SAMN04489727_6686 [Amycolatopsis tolypomycina]
MFVVLRPGVLVRVLAATAFAAVLLFLLLGGLASGPAGTSGTSPPSSAGGGGDPLARTAPAPYVVAGTGKSGLNIRSCAAATCRRVGWVAEGGTFQAECWTHGTPASGDDRWLRGSAAGRTGYAAGHFLRGDGVPECGTSAARRT